MSSNSTLPSPFAHSIRDLASDVLKTFIIPNPPETLPITGPPVPTIEGQIISRLNHAIISAWAPNTLARYRLSVERFVQFCTEQHISHEFQLPASEFLLCAFAASSSGLRSGSTIRNDISAVRAWHIINNVPYFGGLRLNYTLKGVENLTPDASRRPPRPPISLHMLSILHEYLDMEDPLDACCWAAAVTAFWGQTRLGEILSKWQTRFAPHTIPSPSDLNPQLHLGGTVKLHLPFTKTKGRRGETIFLCPQFGCSNPSSALSIHLQINNVPPNLPLFSYHSPNGLIALTTRKLLSRCNSIWSTRGLPSCSGHSFRIGGTTELLLSNVPPHIVKLLGRWSSDAFLRYWRNLEHIAPMHASYLTTQNPIVT
jgi:hypothetical protein